MATVVSERTTCDGHNVKCLFGTKQLTLHFTSVPETADKLETIALTEQRLLDDVASSYTELETLDGILNW